MTLLKRRGSFPANPADVACGQAGRHLATPRISGVHPQTRTDHHPLHWLPWSHLLILLCLFGGEGPDESGRQDCLHQLCRCPLVGSGSQIIPAQEIMSKRVLIIASNGSEEMELIITSDVLRRGGIEVVIAGLQDEPSILCRSEASINVDKPFKDVLCESFDAVILPGGLQGSEALAQDSRVGEVLHKHESQGKLLAAICAGPVCFKAHNICPGATLTSYPAVKGQFENSGYTYSEDKVVVWKNLVTSRGPGTSFDFALKLVDILVGPEKEQEVRKALLL